MVPQDGQTQRGAELILVIRGNRCCVPAFRIQIGVAEILPDVAMNLVGAGLDARVHDGARRVSEFRAVVTGLQIEFGKRVRRRTHDEAGAVEEVDQVGIVVYSVKDEVVLFRSLAVGHKVAGAASARVPEGRSDTGSQSARCTPSCAHSAECY